MSIALGSAVNYSTWGKLRCAYSKNSRDCTVSNYNVTYNSGLKSSASGSGLIRIKHPFTNGSFYRQPNFANFYSPPFEEDANAIILTPESFGAATVETEAQLTGETITLTGGSMVINSTLFGSFGTQNYADGSVDYGTITSIGKLTAF
jgi:hypothetical protein